MSDYYSLPEFLPNDLNIDVATEYFQLQEEDDKKIRIKRKFTFK